MRLPNFLSTVSNRASLSITQTLYDRRALDCTSARPLVQSLQQLMVLTGSSSRVRETLCQDGGIERIVQIMKESAAPGDELAPYKWHLGMQCLLNLGARGSETVRKRILEAGAISLIATVLDNYLVAHGDGLEHRDRDRAERADRRGATPSLGSSAASTGVQSLISTVRSVQGGVLPAQPTSSTATNPGGAAPLEGADGTLMQGPQAAASQAERFLTQFSLATGRPLIPEPPLVGDSPQMSASVATPAATAGATLPGGPQSVVGDAGMPQFVNGLLVPREQDVFWALEIIAFVSKYSHLRREMQATHFLPQMSLRPHQDLFAGLSDDSSDDAFMEDECRVPSRVATPGEFSDAMDVEEAASSSSGSLAAGALTAAERAVAAISAAEKCEATLMAAPATVVDEWASMYYAYDFENTVDFDDEYLTRPVNLFELVERFTAFRAPREFPHWACIIMRNFVRKDENQGGIRQCANFACGKWEEYPRQFAKCRRCKRTKYCSKACQLKSWSMHRYWCAPATSTTSASASTSTSSAHVVQPTAHATPQPTPQDPTSAQTASDGDSIVSSQPTGVILDSSQ